ncbi:hypothetical protein [Nostoc sp. DSM 114167]|jgi:hypothetical protein|uniref:hypothetical protein n=1 Tax=Nostoc sp. DSM 114167 TaxID=3439050 RepID=UPI004045CBFE
MIDDIKISSGIINNPQMKVEFNTNTQSTYLNQMGDWMFHYSGGSVSTTLNNQAGVTHAQLHRIGARSEAKRLQALYLAQHVLIQF